MYLLIVALPLLGFLASLLFHREWLAVSAVAGALALSLFAFVSVGLGSQPVTRSLRPWRVVEGLDVHWSFLFDTLTVVRLVVVTSMSSLVHLYSRSYREHDPARPRFRSYLSLFTFFRLMLVTGANFVQRFVGWEGVGLCSYLLMNFWSTRIQANKAAMKARLVNRVGDFGLVLGRLALYVQFQSLDYAVVFARAPTAVGETRSFLGFSVDVLTVACLLLFVGAVGKSAQLGLHTWLPDAREGPTPVSALMHAATRVTAGVFLLARCSPLFEYAPVALQVVTVFGASTAFFAATTALRQSDLKRVMAYSTCSQLGYRVFAAGLSSYSVAVFHLSNHAFFKALLFLGAGSVIHARGDEQDRRRRGGLVRMLPLTYAALFMGSMALRGFPFLTGFYSKDVMLEVAYGSHSVAGHYAHWLGTAAAACTAYYSRRLLYLTFLSPANGYRAMREGAHDAPLPRALPLRILRVGSMFMGWFSKDRFMGLGTSFWNNALFTHPERLVRVEAEFLPHSMKLTPVVFSLSGGAAALALFLGAPRLLVAAKRSAAGRRIFTFLNRKWFFDKVINENMAQVALDQGYHRTYKTLDRGVFELLGPFGMSNFVSRRADALATRHSGHLYHAGLLRLAATLLMLLAAVHRFTARDGRLRALRLASLLFFGAVHRP